MKMFLRNSVVVFVFGWIVASLLENLLKQFYVGVVDHREIRQDTAFWMEKMDDIVENIKEQKVRLPEDMDILRVRKAYDQVLDALMYPHASGVYVQLVTENYYEELRGFLLSVSDFYITELDRTRRLS